MRSDPKKHHTVYIYSTLGKPGRFSWSFVSCMWIHDIFYLSLSFPSIYILCLAVCLFVCLYPINVKTNELIRSKFCVGPHMTPRKVYGCSILQNFFEFCKILKMHEKYYEIRETFLFLFYIAERENALQIKPQLKVEIEDGRWVPRKPSVDIFLDFYCYFACMYVLRVQ